MGLLLPNVVDGCSFDILRADSGGKCDVQVTEAGNRQLDLRIRAQLFLGEVVQGRGRKVNIGSLPRPIASRNRRRANEVMGVKPEMDAIIFWQTASIEIEFGMAGNAAEVQDCGVDFFRGCSSAFFPDDILHGRFADVQPHIPKIWAGVHPKLLIHREEVLAVRLRDAHIPNIGKIRDRSFRTGRRICKDQQQEYAGKYLHSDVFPPDLSPARLFAESCSQSRWYTNEIASNKIPRTMKLT